MPRKKDDDKRILILNKAKQLFAEKGYETTSMSSLAIAAGLPVGSVYTYFDSKDDLLSSIIEDGWDEFFRGIEEGMAAAVAGASERQPSLNGNLVRLSYLLREALPALLKDAELIAILFAQAGKSSRLNEKLAMLSEKVADIIQDFQAESAALVPADLSRVRLGLAIMLLGSLETVRLVFHSDIGVCAEEVLQFMVWSVEGSLNCRLPDVSAWRP